MDGKIVFIDGHSILNRAFYGLPDLTNAEGLHTNAVYGFLNILFKILEEEQADCFNPETGELMLGDIMISVDRVLEQAKQYGHSVLREYAFLIAHSMLHLFGYDHVDDQEMAREMERRQ